jgi:ABC-2 type transport system permease protein
LTATPTSLPSETTKTTPAPRRGGFALAVRVLAWREGVRLLRQRGRIMGALATPVLLWLAIGVGLDRAMVMDTVPPAEPGAKGAGGGGVGYLAYFYPGMVLMMVLFTAIFSTISVIEDRKEGFLQAVLVSPASRFAIVLGKVLGGAGVAALQGVALVAAWPLVGPFPGVLPMLGAIGLVFAIAVGLTALGLCFAWRMDSAAAYHGVMSLVLMPMWLLCGAVFPLATAGPLKYVMYANPLTYGYAAFATLMHGDASLVGIAPVVSFPVTGILLIAVLAWSVRIASRTRADGK